MASLRMVLRYAPYHGRTPVVADPDRLFCTKRIEQLDHVGDDVPLGIILMAGIDTRASIAPHVRSDGAKAKAAEGRKLVAPGDR